MYNSILSTGKVGPPVAEFAKQACSTQKGAEWLTSYLDPAHGSCECYPDEDNNYSFALQSKFNFTIGYNDLFYNPSGTLTAPDTVDLTIYGTPFADYPICIKTTVNNGGNQNDCWLFVEDSSFRSNLSKITEFRPLYKGFTCSYAGNMYNNEGVMTVSQYNYDPVLATEINVSTSGDSTTAVPGNSYWRLNAASCLPVSANDIARCNRDYVSYRQDQGCYCSQKLTGSRSEYRSPAESPVSWGKTTNDKIYKYGHQVGATAEDSIDAICCCNLSWVVCNISGLNIQQTLNISVFGGYQCHFSYNSGMNVFQTNKSYLDLAAIEAASQLSASIPCIYPSSYNDFKAVWSKIKNFFGSKGGRQLVDTIALFAGQYGGLVTAAGEFIANSYFVC